MNSIDASEKGPGDRFGFAVPSAKTFVLILLVYFGLQTVIRTLISGTVDLDESEQLILTQKFSWGYGSQPPLYTWMQMLFFKLFGVSVFALALLKNLLLFSIYFFIYLNVRFVTRSHVCGVLGAVSLLFIPQVSWESQRDLTHSVLASAWVAATMFVFLRLRGNWWSDYAVFGFCAGLGILSKYNYLAFLFGLVLAALTTRRFDPVVRNKRMAISLAVCLLILSPHLLWALNNRELVSSTAYKFRQQLENPYFLDIQTGLLSLFIAVIFHIGPILAIFILVFRRDSFDGRAIEVNQYGRLILRKYGLILAGLMVVIFAFRVTGFKDRWFEPIFISLPILLFAVVQDRLKAVRVKAISAMGCIVALLVLSIIPGRIIWAEKIGRTQLLNAPYASLKAELAKSIPAEALVIAENKWVGGNLRMLFPDLNVVTPGLAQLYSIPGRSVVAVWDGSRRDTPGPGLNILVEGAGMKVDKRADFVAAPYRFHREKIFRLGLSGLKRRND